MLKSREPILLNDTSSVYDWTSSRDISSAISWIINNEMPIEIDVGTSFGFTNLELLILLEELLEITNQLSIRDKHITGLNEVFGAGKNSPLFASGWLPRDSLTSGLKWVLDS